MLHTASSLSTAAIASFVVGLVVVAEVFMLAVLLSYCCWRHRKKQKRKRDEVSTHLENRFKILVTVANTVFTI